MRIATPLAFALALAAPAAADTVVAARTIRGTALIEPGDLRVVAGDTPGTFADPAEVAGLEARVMLYQGRPIRRQDVGAPALVDRNEIVPIRYSLGGLAIATEGRALTRGAAGERVRVMNLNSKTTVSGVVGPDGTVFVTGSDFPEGM